MQSNPYQRYQNNSIMTAKPAELTLMLYNGAVKFCNLTLKALEEGDMQNANQFNLRVQDIITELQATLDTKYSIGEEMDVLYTFIKELLIQGNIHKDAQKILDAKELISEFRDTWQQIVKNTKGGIHE